MEISNEIIGIAAGVMTSTAMIPQVIKTVKEKNAENISPFMVIILVLGTATWTYYGILKGDMPLIITNIFSCFVNSLMLFFKIRYSNK